VTLQTLKSNSAAQPPKGAARKPVFSHAPQKPASPQPPGYLKQTKTVPAPAPQSKGRKKVPGHGGAFPALPPLAQGRD
jgi:hypothetical protein